MTQPRAVRVELPHDDLRIRFAADETIVFASSSGHCNLDCTYCVVHPVVKHQPSLTYEDLRFIIDRVGGKLFFIFSGAGDFFAGYRPRDRLLARLLEHDNVRVALDVNGVAVHCIDVLSTEQLAKIAQVNLTFHYRQLEKHRALDVWRRNAELLLNRCLDSDLFITYILSPSERCTWSEGMEWYGRHIYGPLGKPVVLINDVDRPFAAEDEAALAELRARYGQLICDVRRGDFASVLSSFDKVLCPAGQSYFRVWNDGRIESCPNVETLRDAGNAKQRAMRLRSEPFECRDVRHCDCYHIASAGRMTFLIDELRMG